MKYIIVRKAEKDYDIYIKKWFRKKLLVTVRVREGKDGLQECKDYLVNRFKNTTYWSFEDNVERKNSILYSVNL